MKLTEKEMERVEGGGTLRDIQFNFHCYKFSIDIQNVAREKVTSCHDPTLQTTHQLNKL